MPELYNTQARAVAKRFLDFVNTTGSPYHSVKSICQMLEDLNFQRLDEKNQWQLTYGGKYFVIRNLSTILTFIVGNQFSRSSSGFNIIGTHTDSPCLRTRPNNDIKKSGVSQVGIQTYGGGLWHTWFDRGLGIAGKVVIQSPSQEGALQDRLIHVKKPIAYIPSLAIHLTTAEERNSFKFDTETHLQPIIACDQGSSGLGNDPKEHFSSPLVTLIANQLSCNISDIVDFDICFMDATESRFCGVNEEFIESPRLDNLGSTWAAFAAIADDNKALSEGSDIYISVAFDHEEVGSTSYNGADSNFLGAVLSRIASSLDVSDSFYEMLARSFFISADMAHGVHPNYPEKHQSEHRVAINKGVVIKTNSSLKYITDTSSTAMLKAIAKNHDVPIQYFVVRNGSPCGSTIGPMISANFGIPGIDLGIPQWAMHSIREICGTGDFSHLLNLFKGFFADFRKISNSYQSP